MSKAFGTGNTRIERFKRPRSNDGDRMFLMESEARALYATWKHTNQKVLTAERIEWIERMYGAGSVTIIRDFMDKMRSGEMS